MHVETERKFLIAENSFQELATVKKAIAQGYLSVDPERTVRVRLADDKGFLTIKGQSSPDGMSRQEFEVTISALEASALMRLCLPGKIEKTRYIVPFGEYTIEVDVFHGENAGLVIAEVELPSPDAIFSPPAWFGAEVTGVQKYYNAELRQHPFTRWQK
jgi:adenylate cyclase